MNNLESIEQSIPILQQTKKYNGISLVLVTKNNCGESSELQLQLLEQIEKYNLPVMAFTICYEEDQLPFPEPIVNVLYFFAPNKDKPLFKKAAAESVSSLKDDVNVAYEMYNGLTYQKHIERVDANQKLLEKKTEKMFENEEKEKEKYPSKFKMARNIARDMWTSAKRAAKALPVIVPDNVAKERLDLCMGCEHFTDEERCTQCGCYMTAKVNLAGSSCPIGKWNDVL